MGGNVAWTLRLSDGTEFRMLRWTNIFPEITMTDGFLAGDPAEIAAALESWLAMKADWETNRTSGVYANTMTDCYAPYPFGLRPGEYGFIVTDFVSKTIVSCQHYTTLNRYFLQRLVMLPEESQPARLVRLHDEAAPHERSAVLDAFRTLTSNAALTGEFILQRLRDVLASEKPRIAERAVEREEIMATLTRLQEASRILSFTDQTGDVWKEVSAAGLTVDEIIARSLGADGLLATLSIQPPDGWTLRTFTSNTSEGRRDALVATRSLGLALDEAETRDFESWIAAASADN